MFGITTKANNETIVKERKRKHKKMVVNCKKKIVELEKQKKKIKMKKGERKRKRKYEKKKERNCSNYNLITQLHYISHHKQNNHTEKGKCLTVKSSSLGLSGF